MATQALEPEMKKVIEHFNEELGALRTGRAHPGLVENIPVEAYGNMTPLKGLASISTPEPRLIQISPWDKSLAKAIEKAIQLANLGLNPSVSGDQIRLRLPELTAERREELIKVLNTKSEEARISLRNLREDYLKGRKAQVADKAISEDELERSKKEVQQLIDRFNTEIETLAERKSEQIRTV